MDKYGIDASISLRFSLELFKGYKSTGILQAKLHRFPGVQGPGNIYLRLVEGVVVSCYIEDKNRQHSPVSKDVLIRFDNEKGPLEWSFRATSAVPALPAPPQRVTAVQLLSRRSGSLSSQKQHPAVSRIVSFLPGERLLGWPLQQRRMFLLVWGQIDGKKTVQDIKTALGLSLPEAAVEEIVQTLLKLKLIMIGT